MLGAIIGDIVGSRFEWNNIKTKDFELLNYHCMMNGIRAKRKTMNIEFRMQ